MHARLLSVFYVASDSKQQHMSQSFGDKVAPATEVYSTQYVVCACARNGIVAYVNIENTEQMIHRLQITGVHANIWWQVYVVFVCVFGDTWVCGESWLAIKDSLTHRPSSQGWAPECPLGSIL